MLGHTDTHTNTIEPTFFSDPPEEIFDHNTLNAESLKPLLSTILNLEAGIAHQRCIGDKIVDFIGVYIKRNI